MNHPVHLVLPAGLDDPTRPSGGNRYDRRIADGLATQGWQVNEHQLAGNWPCPDRVAIDALGRLLAGLPDGRAVVLDGVLACCAAEVIGPAAVRLRLVVLVHLPLGLGPVNGAARQAEAAVLAAVDGVIATSDWSRRWLLKHYGLDPWTVSVAEPGTDPAPLAFGTEAGTRLLCVAAVAPHKGQDVLVAGLARVADRDWRCRCLGSLDRDPAFAAQLRGRLAMTGLAGRVELAGAADDVELASAYASADLLVLPSHGETYGMVVTEALARGIPVIGSEVGGVPEALGYDGIGHRPGLLVPAGNPVALATALGQWLDDPTIRASLRRSARQRRIELPSWDRTTEQIIGALTALVG